MTGSGGICNIMVDQDELVSLKGRLRGKMGSLREDTTSSIVVDALRMAWVVSENEI